MFCRSRSQLLLLILSVLLFSSSASADSKCGQTFTYSPDADGTFLMGCSVAARFADPVQHALDQAKEACEEEHQDNLAEIAAEVIPKWKQQCEAAGCKLTHTMIDRVDCSKADGFAYCSCEGGLECHDVSGGSLQEPLLSRRACLQRVRDEYNNSDSIRMVKGCEGQANGGTTYVFGACISPSEALVESEPVQSHYGALTY